MPNNTGACVRARMSPASPAVQRVFSGTIAAPAW